MDRRKLIDCLLNWFSGNARDLPWRRTRDPYAIWVSEIMLQQTQVNTVVPYWERWMREMPTVGSLAKAKPERIHKLWEGLGYYTRVRNMQKAAQVILAQHGGEFPTRFEAVLELPGIGRYTAGAICSIAFGQPTPVLDGNVIRVMTRLRGVGGNPHEREVNARLWGLAEQLVRLAAQLPERASPLRAGGAESSPATVQNGLFEDSHPCSLLNQSLMELGAMICTPRQPKCGVCPVAAGCAALKQGRVHELPELGQRISVMPCRFVAFVVQASGRFLVRQRPDGVVNGHLWEFPNMEMEAGEVSVKRAAQRLLGITTGALEPLCTVKHSITRYRITLQAYRISGVGMDVAINARARSSAPGRAGIQSSSHVGGSHLRSRSGAASGVWLTKTQLKRLPFASAHKKILARLEEMECGGAPVHRRRWKG